MGGDSIKTITVLVEIQENGIIRFGESGHIIGRLNDGVSFEYTEELDKQKDVM